MSAITRRTAMHLAAGGAAALALAGRSMHSLGSPVAEDAASPSPPRPESIRHHTFTTPTGGRMHVADLGRADAPAILCLHGYTDCWHSFRLAMPLLATTHRVIAPDMRGHGDSTSSDDGFSLDALAGDAATVLDALSIDAAVVIGHSYGSFVARRLASNAPRRVRQIILVGAGLSGGNQPVRQLHTEVVQQGEVMSHEFVEVFQASTVLDRGMLPEWFFAACVNASMSVQPRDWRDALAALINDHRVQADVGLPCPALVIGGEQDAVFSADEHRALAKALPKGRLLLYRHCAHAPNWEQPARFAEDVQCFASGA